MFVEDPPFPHEIAYGAIGGPEFHTLIVDSPAGAERRVQQWPLGPAVYDLSLENRGETLTRQLISFFVVHAKGMAHGFRFRDFQPGESTGTFEYLGTGDGTRTYFQLLKQYSMGGLSYRRVIRKPVPGTVIVYVDSQQASTGFSVDYTTGIVSFSTPIPDGIHVGASFTFDVPVRFQADWLDIRCVDPAPTYTWQSIQLKEVRPR